MTQVTPGCEPLTALVTQGLAGRLRRLRISHDKGRRTNATACHKRADV